ncbi:MAG: SAM-dependent methyltransferase [Clostridiales bacterium]|nr:SAM-dependent methyltransferase [Clostridiales bacterium]
MKLPICKRLLCCAAPVEQGARVADVGCDHGYLGIYLLQSGQASFVHASDLREMPIKRAMQNAAQYGVAEKMRFSRADGLTAVQAGTVDTVVCAGMGGDLIAQIVEAAPWLKQEGYTLILQPQSSGNDLRRYLGEAGFAITEERLVQDGRFLYAVMKVRYGGGKPLSPGRQYASDALLSSDDPLLLPYLSRIEHSLKKTVAGISKGITEEDRKKLAYYGAALEEISVLLQAIKTDERGQSHACRE